MPPKSPQAEDVVRHAGHLLALGPRPELCGLRRGEAPPGSLPGSAARAEGFQRLGKGGGSSKLS